MFKIDWIENKNADWKVISVTKEDGTKATDVSVNRVGKKGDVFPNFDGLAPGGTTEGELWVSTAGKKYLFPPKVRGEGMGPRPAWVAKKDTQITKAMDRKEESIEKAQDNKHEAIRMAGAQRDAVLIATTFYANQSLSDEQIEGKVEYWYQYFLKRTNEPF